MTQHWKRIAMARGYYLVQAEPRLIVGHLRSTIRFEGAEAWHWAAVSTLKI